MRDAVTEIADGKIVLPVIQRRLEWNTDKMEMLFDSLFRQNSFGSIICIEEEKGLAPLFAHRLFTVDGSKTSSIEYNVIHGNNLLLVIDGQQRLQSFYMGLCGNYEGKILYYDLFSDYKSRNFDFNFTLEEEELPTKNSDRQQVKNCLWYSVPALFMELKRNADTDTLAEKIIAEKNITDISEQRLIEKNITVFYARIFADKSIGISEVVARISDDITEDRQRVTELFRRLNFEGMKLSIYDLVASQLKNFNYKMENFLEEVTEENSSIGINQDVLIKLLLILNDKPRQGAAELNAEDAEFATDNSDRIRKTLTAMKKFLALSNNEKWFDTSKNSAIKKSAIPLYFIAYYIFHQDCTDEEVLHLFDRYETDTNAQNIALWLKLSLLNQIFRKGCGWQADKTGIRKIHEILSKSKGKKFPIKELFDMYIKHPLKFITASQITFSKLDQLDIEYIFYMIYGGVRSSIRTEDKDHIQPRSLLEKAKFSQSKINSIGNLMLIDLHSNRAQKHDLELQTWLTFVQDRQEYLKRHLIPDDPELWKIGNFDKFLRTRLQKISDAIREQL